MYGDKNFTGRDILSIRNEIVDFIKRTTTALTDFNESEILMVLIEALAGVSDMLNYYIDNNALECFIASARQPKNVRNMLEWQNYKLPSIGTAVGEVTLALLNAEDDTSWNGFIHIPRGTRLTTQDIRHNVEYVTLEDALLDMETPVRTVRIVQGKQIEHEIETEKLAEYYIRYLRSTRIPLEFVEVLQEGYEWECVEDAFLEIYGGHKYSIHADAVGQVYIKFTYDWRNYLQATDTMKLRWIVSDGEKGLVQAREIIRSLDPLLDDDGINFASRVTIYNEAPTYGAFDQVNLALAKANARNAIKSMDRCINIDDFNGRILKEPYILKCYTTDWNYDPDLVKRPYEVHSWVVTLNLLPYDAQLEELRKSVMKTTNCTVKFIVHPAEIVPFTIGIKVALKGSGGYRDQIRERIVDAFQRAFTPDHLTMGMVVADTVFFQLVQRITADITHIEIEGIEGHSVRLEKYQFPSILLGEVALIGNEHGYLD